MGCVNCSINLVNSPCSTVIFRSECYRHINRMSGGNVILCPIAICVDEIVIFELSVRLKWRGSRITQFTPVRTTTTNAKKYLIYRIVVSRPALLRWRRAYEISVRSC